MKPRQIVSPQEMTAVLDQAVRERALATLSLTCANEWICYKSRFLERDPNRRFFVLDWGVEGGEPKIELGQYVGISFRYRSRKVMFSTVLEARGRFMAETDTPTPAARYRWPESLTEIQRRAYYRTPIPAGIGLLASMWVGGRARRAAAQEAALGVVLGECADISCGGTLIRLNQVQPPDWVEDQTIGMELHLPDGRAPAVLDAHYRGTRFDAAEQICAAVQFVGLETTSEGRNTLQRLARTVQRFHRLTIAPELRSPSGRVSIE